MERPAIVGNKWVLTGALLYLLEWVAIIPAGNSGPADPEASRTKVLSLYHDHPNAVLFITSWLGVVLLGRVLLVMGLRRALGPLTEDRTLLDYAVASMALSVAIEVVSYGLIGSAQVAATRGADDTVVVLDTVGGVMNQCIFAPLGVSVGLAAFVMLRSRAFPTWIPVLGVLGGLLLVVGGVLAGPAYIDDGAVRTVANIGMFGVPLFWVWMLAAGVFLWRRTPARAAV